MQNIIDNLFCNYYRSLYKYIFKNYQRTYNKNYGSLKSVEYSAVAWNAEQTCLHMLDI